MTRRAGLDGARPGLRRAAARLAARTLARLALAAVLVVAAPVTLTAAVSYWVAWLGGWPPARLYRAALWLLPVPAIWLAATGIARHAWRPVLAAPYLAWVAAWHLTAAGDYPRAAIAVAPLAIPAGIAAGGAAWAYRIAAMATAAGGASPASGVAFDRRQWRHQARAARARISAPGAVPLTTAAGDVVTGAVIRTAGRRPAGDLDDGLARLPYQRLRSHQVVIGGTGTGKTTLLLRLWAAFMATALRRHAAGLGRPPLLVVLDCKGGRDARRIAERFRRVQRDAGAAAVAIWPDEASLSLWDLPPGQLITTLVDLVEHGTGGAAYYADILDAVVALAVGAPCGPPASSEDFLARLDAGWLARAHQAGDAASLALIGSARRQVTDVALRYRTLFRRLGPGLDGPGGFAAADAWYVILEGTTEAAVAEAQARAVTDLLASYVTSGPGDREVLLAVDEFSAVARRLPVAGLYERARSLGLAVQVSAQSWHGLAPEEDDRYRIVSAAEGGVWLLRTPHPEPVTALAGQAPALDTSRELTGYPRWSRSGSARLRDQPVADPALIRGLDVGQAAYLYRGGVTYIQVSRLAVDAPALRGQQAARPGPTAAALAGLTAGPAGLTAGRPDGRGSLADVTPLLDAAFGPEPAVCRDPAVTGGSRRQAARP